MSGEFQADAVIAVDCAVDASPNVPVLKLDAKCTPERTATARAWLERHVRFPMQRVALCESGDLKRLLGEHYHRIAIDQFTIENRAAEWSRHFLRCLVRKPALRWASAAGRPWAGRPAFVVGGGPSLDINGHLLREAQSRGPVVAVNRSLSACLHHGVVPDVVITAESADKSEHFRCLDGMEQRPTFVLDVMGHPAHWDLMPDALAVCHHEPNFIPYAVALGGAPLNYSGSVACAATSLAIQWGAAPVVLLGQDIAYTGGRMYATGVGADHVRVVIEGSILRYVGMDRGPMHVTWRDGWGGSDPVPSDHGMDAVARWFASAATKYGGRIINATEGGSRIAGAGEKTLANALADLPAMPPWQRQPVPDVPEVDASAVVAELRAHAHAILAGEDVRVSDCPLINMWTVPVETAAGCRDLSARDKHARIREAMMVGAREILEVIDMDGQAHE